MARGQESPLQRYIHKIARRHELEKLTDAQLLQEYVEGNGDAITELVKRHYALVLSACRGQFRDFSEAEDVCVAAFIVLMEKANQKWQSSVGAWLYKTAWQIAKQKQADIARGRKREGALKMKKPDADPAQDLSELCNKLHEELANLSERYRAPVVLCYLEGKSRDEAVPRTRSVLTDIGSPQGKGAGTSPRTPDAKRDNSSRRLSHSSFGATDCRGPNCLPDGQVVSSSRDRVRGNTGQ